MAKTYGEILQPYADKVASGYNWIYDAGLDAANAFWDGADTISTNISNATEGIKTPEVGLLDTVPGNYFTTDNWFPPEVLEQINPAGTTANGMTIPTPLNLFGDDGIDWANPDLTYTSNDNQFFGDEDADFDANTVYNMGEMDDGPFIYNRRGYDDSDNLLPGWRLGLDDVPYNHSLADSLINDSRASGGGGGYSNSSGGSVPSAPVLRTRTFPFTSRTPSGSVYAPDMSAYNDSSLFNYTGPGGTNEYTYGQGLPTQGAGYDIWGSPADIDNPYFSGQFATEPQGPADAAIHMPAVELPEGVQPVSADVSMPGFTGSGNQIIGGSLPSGITPRPPSSAGDLTYQQTIDEMGIFGPNNPPPSTLFPGPNDKLIEEQILNQNAIKAGLDRGGVHDTGAVPPTAEQLRALSDINYGKTSYASPGNPHGTEPLRTIDRQRLTYGKPLEMPIGDNLVGNEIPGRPGELSAFSENDLGMVDARRNYLFNKDLDLGRPGDASYEEFVPNPSLFTDYPGLDAIVSEYKDKTETDYGVLAQAKADQMMANLTDEELRDGLFLEPQLKREDGEIVGKMGIPDIFTQDKTPIKPRDASLFDYNFEFDPDNPYLEQDITDGFLWQDNDGNYHRQWDDMGLVDIVPGMNDPEFLRGEALTESRKQTLAAEQAKQDKIAADANQARAEKAQREHEIYVREQLAARDAVLEAQAVARAEAEAQAQAAAQAQAVAAKQAQAQAAAQAEAQAIAQAQAQAQAQARAQAAAQAEERTQVREQARRPVYTAPSKPAYTPPASTGSSWSPSYGTGGIWRL